MSKYLWLVLPLRITRSISIFYFVQTRVWGFCFDLKSPPLSLYFKPYHDSKPPLGSYLTLYVVNKQFIT